MRRATSCVRRATALCAVCGILAAVCVLSAQPRPRPALAPSDVDEIARLLMLEDTRQFDREALSRDIRSSHPEVRRRAALAIGRIADPAGFGAPGIRARGQGSRRRGSGHVRGRSAENACNASHGSRRRCRRPVRRPRSRAKRRLHLESSRRPKHAPRWLVISDPWNRPHARRPWLARRCCRSAGLRRGKTSRRYCAGRNRVMQSCDGARPGRCSARATLPPARICSS